MQQRSQTEQFLSFTAKIKEMEKATFTIGVDVSRNTLDIYCTEVKQHIRIANSTVGFARFSSFCKQHHIAPHQAIVVLEYTGGYEYKWLQFCQSKNLAYVRIPGLAIKRSLALPVEKTTR